MVPKGRIELPTYRLRIGCSTAELLRRAVGDFGKIGSSRARRKVHRSLPAGPAFGTVAPRWQEQQELILTDPSSATSEEDLPRKREPMLNVPPVTAALIAVTVGVHLLRALLPIQLDAAIIVSFGFIPVRYTVPELFGWPAFAGPFGYLFLHGSTLHLAMNMAMLIAFGAGIERRIGGRGMLLFYFLTGAIAALVHFVVYPDSDIPVVGASGAISGLFGGIVVLLHRRRGGGAPPRSFVGFVLVWVAFTVIVGVIGIPGDPDVEVAWVAHLGGFGAGVLLFRLFDRRD